MVCQLLGSEGQSERVIGAADCEVGWDAGCGCVGGGTGGVDGGLIPDDPVECGQRASLCAGL